MKSLAQYITNEDYDMLGHELHVGDWIQFQSVGLKLYGEITEITTDEKPKYIIKTMGWYGDPSLRSKVKEQYKINTSSKSLFLLNVMNKK